jgi:ornithine cyclodeaminase/alanine dehydrogenase-like protein (mu-crystallin family)
MEAEAVEGPGEVLDDVSLVVTATTSKEPVLPEEIPDGVFVAAVGAFEPEAAELPPALISTSQIFVDTLEGARDEAGDLIQAQRASAFKWEQATELEGRSARQHTPKGRSYSKAWATPCGTSPPQELLSWTRLEATSRASHRRGEPFGSGTVRLYGRHEKSR